MSQSFDLSRFPNLPPEVVQAFAAQQAALEAAQFEVVVERAARQHEQAVVAEKEAFITELKALIERLEGQESAPVTPPPCPLIIRSAGLPVPTSANRARNAVYSGSL